MLRPPRPLITRDMIFGVMDRAERHGKLIADLEGYASRLRVADVMGMRRGATTDEARLAPDKAHMFL
jgi:hypothetical protein